MQKILISACLLGNKVRYDGQEKKLDDDYLRRWSDEGRLVPLCPEVAGGLPVPRPAAEMNPVTNIVTDVSGVDVTAQFSDGANQALELCKRHNIRYALLTEFSPSCGSGEVYDGTFTGRKIEGAGVTTSLLVANGIQVFSQHRIVELAAALFENNELEDKDLEDKDLEDKELKEQL